MTFQTETVKLFVEKTKKAKGKSKNAMQKKE